MKENAGETYTECALERMEILEVSQACLCGRWYVIVFIRMYRKNKYTYRLCLYCFSHFSPELFASSAGNKFQSLKTIAVSNSKEFEQSQHYKKRTVEVGKDSSFFLLPKWRNATYRMRTVC